MFPIAPDPLLPEASAPTNATTVIDAATLCARFARNATFAIGATAIARQISAVPSCPFARRTSVHVRLPPVTLVTVIPTAPPSAETNASKREFGEVVVTPGEVMFEAALERPVDRTVSIVSAPNPFIGVRPTRRT